ncbi:flavin reductase family protein [Candidatus Woesearchaeota archaeon]|nr:flavin reductase family protein [Candidatus Woesearchaeota archaeon]
MFAFTNPRQVVLVTSRGSLERKATASHDTIATVEWHMPCSFEPFHYAIALKKTTLSVTLIQQSNVFVVHFIPGSFSEHALFCGRHSGLHVDKFAHCGFTKKEAEKIDCPCIQEALAYLECEVLQSFNLGECVVFIGKVLKAVTLKEGKRLFHVRGDVFAEL